MPSHKELKCIDAAREAKIFYAKRRLDEFCKNGKHFENPLSGIGDALKLKLSPVKKIRQVAFMPVGIVILCLFTPVMYAIHLIEIYGKKSRLKKELALEKTGIDDPIDLKNKTLESLWKIYGLDRHKSTHDERIDLLSKWIAILYGEKTLKKLNINQMAHAIGVKNSNLNRLYLEGTKNTPHFFIRPIVDILIEKLSKDLPKYDLIGINTCQETTEFDFEIENFKIPDFLKHK